MTIVIETIPHKSQRYPTLGDWQWRDHETLLITVSDTGNWRMNMLIAIHEMVEVVLCKSVGISQEVVDHFDIHEAKDSDDPGDLIEAPYRDQHCFATAVERMMCAAMGISWSFYEGICEQLQQQDVSGSR